jgi:hypothetical protein
VSRPLEWAPLADSDPLAGSPEEIEREAAVLRSMAAEMTWQVRTLKGMGTDTTLAGDYAVALRASATDVAAKLEKVIHRYSEAARCLSGWAPELEEFQSRTVTLLLRAQEAEKAAGRDIHADLFTPGVFPAYQQFHATGLGDAPPELALLNKQLQAVLEEAEARGRFWAHQIAEAIDDQLTDGFWDRVHHFVHQAKHAFVDLTEHLGYVTSAVALIGLAVPGLDLVVLGLMVATTLQDIKKASEGGSWFDVGLDAAGLASFGVGKLVISRGLEATMTETRAAAATAEGEEAAEAAREAGAAARDAARNALMEGSGATPAERQEAARTIEQFKQDVNAARQGAVREVEEAPLTEAKFHQVLAAGSPDDVRMANTTNQLLADHPGNQAVKNAAVKLRRQVWAGRANYLGATTLDLADKGAKQAAEHTPWSWAHSYRDFSERWTLSEGALDEPVSAK